MTIVLLNASEAVPFSIELDQEGDKGTRLRILGGTNASATVTLDPPVTIAAALLTTVPDADGKLRLKTLAEIRQEAAQAADQAAQQLEVAWRTLIDELSNARFTLGVDGKFLGALVLPAGQANLIARASLNLGACLLAPEVTLSAALDVIADCDADVAGHPIRIQVAWRLRIDADLKLPRISIRLPALGIDFPEFPLPDFKWPAIGSTNRSFALHLPTLPGIPLMLVHKNKPILIVYVESTGALDLQATLESAELSVFNKSVSLGSPTVSYQGGKLTVSGLLLRPDPLKWDAQDAFALPAPLDGLSVQLGVGSLQLAVSDVDWQLKGYLTQRVSVFPTDNPQKQLVLDLVLPFAGAAMTDSVTIGADTTKRTIQLGPPSAQTLMEMFDAVSVPGSLALNLRAPDLPTLDVDPLIEVLSAILAAIAHGLAGLARVLEEGLRALFALARSAAAKLSDLEVTILLDANSGQLQQVLLSVRRGSAGSDLIFDGAGCTLSAAPNCDLALLLDVRNGGRDAYLVATADSASSAALVSLGTDLWFSSPTTDKGASGPDAPAQKLITVTLEPKGGAGRVSIIPFGIRHGEAVFLHGLETPLPVLGAKPSVGFGAYELVDAWDLVSVKAKFPPLADLKKRFLPFLAAPEDSGKASGIGDALKQYIEITNDQLPTAAEIKDGKFDLPLKVVLHVLGTDLKTDLMVQLDARRMTADVRGGAINISLREPGKIELLGMKAVISYTGKSTPAPVGEEFVLDMRSADTRLYLNDDRKMVLNFEHLGKDAKGRTLEFEVAKLVVHGGGLDLDAKLNHPFTLNLNGLGTEFTFDTAALRVRGGRVEAFSLAAWGKLPPALMGDVDARLQLDFGMRADGSFGLLTGGLELKNKGKPIRSEQTHFELTLDTLSVRAFEDAGDLHFCAFVSGSAEFKPQSGQLANGMLKKLADIKLSFTDCPVCGPSDVIARELEKLNLSFVVALDQPARASLFELFNFEVRSIGFEPRCRMFDPVSPALVIGGQISFAAQGDVVRAECDFHKLYIAPGVDSFLPRIRCEGLGLALRLGRQIEVEGMVTAIDGRMPPNLLESRPPANNIKYNGFLGQGRIAIQGLPPFAASFGFVEVRDPAKGGVRRAWFVYLEAQRLSYYFQLGPVPLYLREAGLGLGYAFTYVGIEAVDRANNVQEMITAMDDISAHAIEPAKVESWTVSDVEDLTLVGRVMISMSSASSPTETLVWKEDDEKELPNLLLLNAVAAMRRTTFLMTAQVWLGYSYYDWDAGRHLTRNEMVGKHTMSGYVILAGARSEFLARVVSNPGAEIGPRLPLPEAFKTALKSVEYDATLYIRPGLLHFELGWPNRIRWATNLAGVNVSVRGGAIFRVHEGAILAGLNLEGTLTAEISGRLDAGVIGIAVSASVYAALTARIIGYLDSQRVANSLYYSLFALQLRVRFEISAWLEIDAWLCKITIRISFAMTLQVDMVAELALQGDLSAGARVRAAIAVSIFGRSIGLSIGLGFNPGLVDNAAARVGRFMNMGLIQEVPAVTPDIGQQDDANARTAELGQQRSEARAAAGAANVPGSKLAQVPHEDPLAPLTPVTPLPALPIGATDFDIVFTYPKVAPTPLLTDAPSNWVYVTFLPHEVFGGKGAAPAKSSFYAAPRYDGASCDHKLRLPVAAVGQNIFIFEDGQWNAVTLGAQLATGIDWDALLSYTQTTEGQAGGVPVDKSGDVDLTKLFFAAFRTDSPNSKDAAAAQNYGEPHPRPAVDPDGEAGGSTQDQYERQEQGYSGHIQQDPADRRCHEARDFLLQMFISDLFQLANDGVVPKSAHVARLGLTLLVRKEVAQMICDARDETVVSKRVGVADFLESAHCAVFNPPTLRFSVQAPRFEAIRQKFDGDKVLLDWNLEWNHVVDAEHFVQHYEVKRWIETADGLLGDAPPRTVKRADKVRHDAQGSRRIVERCPWQFSDEFDDLSPQLRSKLFDPASGASVRYTVVPVCVSGTRGVPCSDFILERIGQPQVAALRRAAAVLVLDPSDPAKADLRVLLAAGEADSGYKPEELAWRLVLRSEAILPAGQYGTDAETQRALGASIGAGRFLRPNELTVTIPANGLAVFPVSGPVDPKDPNGAYGSVTTLAGRFMQQLRDTANPRAFTLHAQAVVLRPKKVSADSPLTQMEVFAESPLTQMELSVSVQGATPAQRVFARVDALELVRLPHGDEYQLLDPVAGVDLHASPGRAVQPEPDPLSVGQVAAESVLHPEFGALTALRWGLRPNGMVGDAAKPYRLLSGFDVLSLDLDGLVQPDKWDWRGARRVTSVRLLGEDSARVTPGELGETSTWKARYPSQRARRLASGAWYSRAESRIEWPASGFRAEPLAEPPSELIKALLRDGTPSGITLEMVSNRGGALHWKFSLPAAVGTCWRLGDDATLWLEAGKEDSAARDLRLVLRELGAAPTETAPAGGYPNSDLMGWALVLTAKWRNKEGKVVRKLDAERIDMHYERDLHPLLEAVVARMRRYRDHEGSERLLDLDRRPPPVVEAATVAGFMAATSAVADPYGWTALDRLGLGVTLRLFDPLEDAFVTPAILYSQLNGAIGEVAASGRFSPDLLSQLFLDVLMKPGAMSTRADFTERADSNGVFANDSGAHDWADRRLAMLHLSVRPPVRKTLQYTVLATTAEKAPSKPADVDVFLPETGLQRSLVNESLQAVFEGLDKARPASGGKPAPIHVAIARKAGSWEGYPDQAPGTLPEDGHPDAFGRFADWPGWNDDADYRADLSRFQTMLRNRLGLGQAETDVASERLQIAAMWAAWTARFFEFCALPAIRKLEDPPLPQYAFAAREAAEPVLAAADSAGRLQVNVLEPDGYAHQRAFAVLPQWRYAKMLEAAGYTRLADAIPDKLKYIAEHKCYAIATIMRTAPIQPCALVPLGRLGDSVWWSDGTHWISQDADVNSAASLRDRGYARHGTDPGDALPVVVRHHPELRLSKANLTPARGLSFSGALTSFVLTAADREWCSRHAIDKLEPANRPSDNLSAGVTADAMAQIAAMLGGPLVDAKVRIARHMPHWYRHAVAVSAGAGSSVAEVTSAYLPEAPARLLETGSGVPTLKAGHPWIDLKIKLPPVVAPGAASGFGVAIPALRYRDTTDTVTAAAWAGPIANLADPGVAYEIELEAPKLPLRPRTVVTPIARLMRAEAGAPQQPFKVFAVSKSWQVRCDFAGGSGDDPRHMLHLTVSPMSLPVTMSGDPSKDLPDFEYVHGSALRVPGGWNAGWFGAVAGALGEADPQARMGQALRLWGDFSTSGIGLPLPDFEGFSMFESYGIRALTMNKPAAEVEWAAMHTALESWIASLTVAATPLSMMIATLAKVYATGIANRSWPFGAGTTHGEPLAWMSGLPEPQAPLGLAPFAGPPPRVLVPELVSDVEYAEILQKQPVLKDRLDAMRKAQRSNAADAGSLRIRATRGDAIALELPLIPLQEQPTP